MQELDAFLADLAKFPWLSKTGAPYAKGHVVADLATGWDDWNEEMMTTWSPQTHSLEQRAQDELGDEGIDDVFERVANALESPLQSAIRAYQVRAGDAAPDHALWPELMDSIERDIAWAAIERVLGEPGFFTVLLGHYRAGRWPCAWEGAYPAGRVVVV